MTVSIKTKQYYENTHDFLCLFMIVIIPVECVVLRIFSVVVDCRGIKSNSECTQFVLSIRWGLIWYTTVHAFNLSLICNTK